MVGDESQLQTTYDLTVEAEGRGYLLPLNAGGTQYAAIWLSDLTPQAPGRPGRGGRICLPRPKIPPGKTCASLHPDPNHPSNWVCTPWYQAFCYTSYPRDCGGGGGSFTVTICGQEAAELKARLGLTRGCINVGGNFNVCVAAGGCVTITVSGGVRIRCEGRRCFKVQRCIRMCCVNGQVVCCEQHRYTRVCTYYIWHFPPPIGSVKAPEACDDPSGPFEEPCGS